MKPAPKPTRRRNETTDLTRPIEAAVNALPGVSIWRPKVLAARFRDMSGAGLCVGSADLVGICTLDDDVRLTRPLGRFLALEVKWPGEKPTADQRLWLELVRRRGGFAAVVHSVEEAVAAVARCRAGESE